MVLSHGTGGSELGHGSLAGALVRHGYLVAALRHPGDNWQDRSLLQTSAARYFTERPQQASRVIDALLADPEWRTPIAQDARGYRVGALGHSAGGYTDVAEQDRFLAPRFHAEWVARHVPGVQLDRIPNALHLAFMDTPSMSIPTEDGDVVTNLPGFDRDAFLQRLAQQLPVFFDKAAR